MQASGVQAAIHELEREVKKVQEAISLLRKIQVQRSSQPGSDGRKPRRLSAQARKRISVAAKKRWAALRAKKSSKS